MKHCCFSFSIDLQSKTPKQRLLSSEACVTVVVRAWVRVCVCVWQLCVALFDNSLLSFTHTQTYPTQERKMTSALKTPRVQRRSLEHS